MASASTPKPYRGASQPAFGSWFRGETLEREVELVRINDRGPYQEGAKLMYPIVSPENRIDPFGVSQVGSSDGATRESTDPKESGSTMTDLRRSSPQQPDRRSGF